MRYPKILLISNRDDFATDYLIYWLAQKDVSYFRLNSEDITEIGFSFTGSSNPTIFSGATDHSLRDVHSIYFRRAPTVFANASNIYDTNFINRERKEFLEGLYLSLHAKWVNPLFKTFIAERKLYQLSLANRIGFKIPKTLVSNDPAKLIAHLNDSETECIIKPISHGLQIAADKAYSIYTSQIDDLTAFEGSALFESPVMIQEKIENYRDIRITVIGKIIFPVEIIKEDSSEVDWRKPEMVKSYKVHEIPAKLRTLILKLHEVLDLTYSAIDFILTPSKEYIFLEINPAGEWVWLEKELGLPISEAIIEELIN